MSMETMAFVLGGILIAAGIFGGGLEIKELKLPQIGGTARFVAALAGVAFVILSLAINLQWIQRPDSAVPPKATQSPQIFPAPMYKGLRLDVCFEWAKRCGEESATAWCRAKGYVRSAEYSEDNVGKRGIPTKLIGSDEVCSGEFCSAFSQITCTN